MTQKFLALGYRLAPIGTFVIDSREDECHRVGLESFRQSRETWWTAFVSVLHASLEWRHFVDSMCRPSNLDKPRQWCVHRLPRLYAWIETCFDVLLSSALSTWIDLRLEHSLGTA